MRLTILLLCSLALAAFGEDQEIVVPELYEEELPGYQFQSDLKDNPVTIEDLSLGQVFILDGMSVSK